MANEMIYDFKKILQEPETEEEPQQIRALKQNFKELNKNFEITSNLKRLNLLYGVAMKIIADAEGNENDFDNFKGEGGFTFLHYAVWANGIGLVKTFLHHEGIDVNAQSDAGLTALQLAIIQNSPKILKILLSHPQIDLNLACLDGWTTLHLAVSYGYEELIAEILKYKYKLQIDARMRHQITPLQLAALLDKGNLVKILLENGADAQLTTETGETALKLAEQFKCQNAEEMLRMHAAAKVLLKNSTKKSAITEIAFANNQMDTFALKNQTTNTETGTSQNLTPIVTKPPAAIYDFSADDVNDAATLQFLRATFEGKIDEMKSLLAHDNINLEAVHKSGKNMWDFAILNGNPAVIECLLEVKNQEVDLTDLLFNAAKMGSLTIVKYLMEIKDLNPKLTHKSQSLLTAAASSDNLALVEYLIEFQNRIQFVRVGSLENVKYLIEVEKWDFKKIKGLWNGTILHQAARNKNLDVIKYFIEEHGLNIMDRDDKGYVPFFSAVESNNLFTVKYFLEKRNLSIHLKDKKNRTAVHIAAMSGHLETVRYLIVDKNAKINAKDDDGSTPLLFSAHNGHFKVFNFLWKSSKEMLGMDQLLDFAVAAAKGKNADIINLIIEEIAVKIPNKYLAAERQEIKDYLLEMCNAKEVMENKTDFLLDAAIEGNLTLITFLIEDVGMDANIKGNRGRTPIFLAVYGDNLEAVVYFVECAKVDLHVIDFCNWTVRAYAFKYRRNAIESYLASKGAPL